MLVACADEEKIPFSIQAAPHDTGTDADAIYNALRGIPTGLVSVPNRYMHSPNEMVAVEDLERAARLCAAFARRLAPDTNFVPREPQVAPRLARLRRAAAHVSPPP